jgi:hypothetical protein
MREGGIANIQTIHCGLATVVDKPPTTTQQKQDLKTLWRATHSAHSMTQEKCSLYPRSATRHKRTRYTRKLVAYTPSCYQAKLARGTDGRQISKDMKRYYRLPRSLLLHTISKSSLFKTEVLKHLKQDLALSLKPRDTFVVLIKYFFESIRL